jgi:hypothetical protein
MRIKEHGSLLQSFVWVIILILVLLFWPRVPSVVSEPEVLIKTHYIYVNQVTSIPEEVIFEEPVPPARYGFTTDDIYLMTVLLCGNGNVDGDGEYDVDFGNQDNHGQISLVLSVVMNRVMSPLFPNTVSEVIWAPNQFSPMAKWFRGTPQVKPESYEIVRRWCEAYDAHDLTVISVPESHLYFTGNGYINISREGW